MSTFFLNIKNVTQQYSHLKRACHLVWSAAPRHITVWSVLLVVQGFLPAAIVYLSKLLVDAIVTVREYRDWQHVRYVALIAAVTVVVMLLMEVTSSIGEWINTAQADLVQDHIKKLIHEKAASVDMILYETPEYHDRMEQAGSDAASRPMALLGNLGSLAQNSITFITIGAMLISYSLWLPLLLVIATLPAFYVVLRFDGRFHEWWKKSTEKRRWIQYYDHMLTVRFAAAEMRMFNLSPWFQREYQKLRTELREERLRHMRKQALAKFTASTAGLAVIGFFMIWMGWRVIIGILTLGDLALFYQAFSRGQGLMRTLLSSAGSMYRNVLYLRSLFGFLDMPNRMDDSRETGLLPKRLHHGINYRNVTFRYPGSEQPVLEDFSLFIPAGKIVVIVGANGAGKTTLQRLLCRFYDPDSGSIELDGTDLRDVPISDLRRFITITFQMPLCYHASVQDVISIGDWESKPNLTRIQQAVRDAGAHEFISQLPNKYETMLGKVITNGTDLSGGEWQRLALARSYLRQAPLILLDEPTSYMDSWTEEDWFDRFRTLCNGRTALIITHRFTIAMRADTIHVMDGGRIIESGTHRELLTKGGKYAQGWKSQMEINELETIYDEPVNSTLAEPEFQTLG